MGNVPLHVIAYEHVYTLVGWQKGFCIAAGFELQLKSVHRRYVFGSRAWSLSVRCSTSTVVFYLVLVLVCKVEDTSDPSDAIVWKKLASVAKLQDG